MLARLSGTGYHTYRNVVDFYDEEARNIVDIFFADKTWLLGFQFR